MEQTLDSLVEQTHITWLYVNYFFRRPYLKSYTGAAVSIFNIYA